MTSQSKMKYVFLFLLKINHERGLGFMQMRTKGLLKAYTRSFTKYLSSLFLHFCRTSWSKKCTTWLKWKKMASTQNSNRSLSMFSTVSVFSFLTNLRLQTNIRNESFVSEIRFLNNNLTHSIKKWYLKVVSCLRTAFFMVKMLVF